MRRVRFTQKRIPDQHGQPVPRELEDVARDCYPLPVVVTPVDVDSVSEITSVSEFEKQYN